MSAAGRARRPPGARGRRVIVISVPGRLLETEKNTSECWMRETVSEVNKESSLDEEPEKMLHCFPDSEGMQPTAACLRIKPPADENTKQLQLQIASSQSQRVMSSEQNRAEPERGRSIAPHAEESWSERHKKDGWPTSGHISG